MPQCNLIPRKLNKTNKKIWEKQNWLQHQIVLWLRWRSALHNYQFLQFSCYIVNQKKNHANKQNTLKMVQGKRKRERPREVTAANKKKIANPGFCFIWVLKIALRCYLIRLISAMERELLFPAVLYNLFYPLPPLLLAEGLVLFFPLSPVLTAFPAFWLFLHIGQAMSNPVIWGVLWGHWVSEEGHKNQDLLHSRKDSLRWELKLLMGPISSTQSPLAPSQIQPPF